MTLCLSMNRCTYEYMDALCYTRQFSVCVSVAELIMWQLVLVLTPLYRLEVNALLYHLVERAAAINDRQRQRENNDKGNTVTIQMY